MLGRESRIYQPGEEKERESEEREQDGSCTRSDACDQKSTDDQFAPEGQPQQ